MVEGVVGRSDVVMAPGELPRIRSQNTRCKPGLVRARQQAKGQLVVVGHVELVEAGAGGVGGGDGLDGGTARSGEAVGEVELGGGAGDGEFALRVVDGVDADGGEADGGGDKAVEDCRGGGTGVGVD